MADQDNKGHRTNDSLTESFTHVRPDPATKAPVLKRGDGRSDNSSSKSAEPAKKS